MPAKFNRNQLAPGHWSNPWRRVQLDQTPAKIRVWLQDKLVTRGHWVGLYLPVASTTSGVVACTCKKATTDQSDRNCLSCYGTQFAPGYLKFMHTTVFFCSAEYAGFTLTNVSISTAKKANILVLDDGQTSGIIETPDKAYTNPEGEDWELKIEAYRRASGSTFTLEFSTNSGASWTPLTLTEVTGSDPTGYGFTSAVPGTSMPGGTVRFRLTMARLSANDLTPAFEIVRVRRANSENINTALQTHRDDFVAGDILVLRPWTQEQDSLEAGRGRLIEHLADRTWTAPLDFFDTSLTPDTPPCKVSDEIGPHAFYEYSNGVQEGTRYALLKTYFNESFGTFTHMLFDDRRVQPGESIALVW